MAGRGLMNGREPIPRCVQTLLAHLGVLPTRLSAVDEAASIEVLCVDKTGTLTRSELKVTAVRPMSALRNHTFWDWPPSPAWTAGRIQSHEIRSSPSLVNLNRHDIFLSVIMLCVRLTGVRWFAPGR